MEEFFANPSFEALQRLTRNVLIEIGETRQLNINRSLRKADLIGIIATDLVNSEIFEESVLDDLPAPERHIAATQVNPIELDYKLRMMERQYQHELEKLRM